MTECKFEQMGWCQGSQHPDKCPVIQYAVQGDPQQTNQAISRFKECPNVPQVRRIYLDPPKR